MFHQTNGSPLETSMKNNPEYIECKSCKSIWTVGHENRCRVGNAIASKALAEGME